MSVGETFTVFVVFHSTANLPANYGLVNQQYKSTGKLQQKFYSEKLFSTQKMRISPADVFPYMVQDSHSKLVSVFISPT